MQNQDSFQRDGFEQSDKRAGRLLQVRLLEEALRRDSSREGKELKVFSKLICLRTEFFSGFWSLVVELGLQESS